MRGWRPARRGCGAGMSDILLFLIGGHWWPAAILLAGGLGFGAIALRFGLRPALAWGVAAAAPSGRSSAPQSVARVPRKIRTGPMPSGRVKCGSVRRVSWRRLMLMSCAGALLAGRATKGVAPEAECRGRYPILLNKAVIAAMDRYELARLVAHNEMLERDAGVKAPGGQVMADLPPDTYLGFRPRTCLRGRLAEYAGRWPTPATP